MNTLSGNCSLESPTMENIPFPEIAIAVKDNPLGLLSLAVILFSAITLKFFTDASDTIKLIVFLFLALGLSGLVYASMNFKQPELGSCEEQAETVGEFFDCP